MKREDALKLAEQGLDELNRTLSRGKSDSLRKYLKLLARFPQYSFQNTILIGFQKTDATHVAGFHTWRGLGRCVKKGEHGIAILAPMISRTSVKPTSQDEDAEDTPEIHVRAVRGFKVVLVFDVSQTEGKELPKFAEIAGDPGEKLARLERLITDDGISIERRFIPGGALGQSTDGTIILRPDLASAESFAVLVHEYGHELLHQHTGRKHDASKTVLETEAEAVAFVVCRAIGLDSTERSADYIQLYRGDSATLAESLTLIQKTAAQIIRRLAA